MSSTERALIANVAAAPDDDAPRLVYADWLGERGDPRGELVVVQCSLARADREDAPASVTEPLREREQVLLAQHRNVWIDPLQDIAVGTYLFRRGFVERLDVLAPSFDGERLREAAPLLRALRTSHVTSVPTYARSLPVEELTLYELTDVPIARWACGHEEVAGVRRLDLHFRNADAELSRARIGGDLTLVHYGLHAPVLRIADPPVLLHEVLPHERDELTSLRFSRVRLDDLRPLASLAALEELALVGCQLPVDQLVQAALPLRSLAITERALSAADIVAILDGFPRLRRLRLSRASIDNAGVAALAAHPSSASLRRLDLSGNRIEPAGAQALESSQHLGGLVALDLSSNLVEAGVAARILRAHARPA